MRSPFRRWLGLACLLFCLLEVEIDAQSSATETSNRSNGDVFFHRIRVFDGFEVIPETNLQVRQGVITGLDPQLEPVEGSEVIEGQGLTLLPGLIDCHTHIQSEEDLRQALFFGVTTELDMMSIPRFLKGLRGSKRNGAGERLADFRSAGAAVTVAKGHGTQFGFSVPLLKQAEDAADFVAARIQEGSDYIKLIYDDGEPLGIHFETLDVAMLQQAIVATHAHQKLAVAHIASLEKARQVIEADGDGFVHLFAEQEATTEFLQLAKSRGVFVVPTAVVISNACGQNQSAMVMEDSRLANSLGLIEKTSLQRNFAVRQGNRSRWEILRKNIQLLHESGVPILAGTDAPNPGTAHGVSLHHELEILTGAGLSPKEALRGATGLAAQAFELTDRGHLAIGKRADLLLVQGDPLTSIRDTRQIHSVWIEGERVHREQRLESLARARGQRQAALNGPRTMLSDFESSETKTPFGLGWSVSTDALAGGTSQATLGFADTGAAMTNRSLLVKGNVSNKRSAYAGAMFMPGTAAFQPADLSRYLAVEFWVRGTKGPFQAMLFTKRKGFQPATQSFEVDDQWQHVALRLIDFDDTDATDVIGFWLGATTAGDFELQVDEVEWIEAKP